MSNDPTERICWKHGSYVSDECPQCSRIETKRSAALLGLESQLHAIESGRTNKRRLRADITRAINFIREET